MTPELQTMLDQLDAIRQDGEAVGSGLSEAQFNWQPAPGAWSIGQCLNHLNFGVTLVLPAFDRAIAEGRAQGKTSSGPFRYGWFSRLAIASMEPPPRWRMKTPMKKSAGSSHRAADVLPEFVRVREQLAERLRKSDGLDLARIRTISPVNRMVRLPLGAYFHFILAHDRRHLWQARQVRNAAGFPAA
jgi:hypothetical protein